ncbi:hypothetical protein MYSI104531_20315 [Mycobacterium simiae]
MCASWLSTDSWQLFAVAQLVSHLCTPKQELAD